MLPAHPAHHQRSTQRLHTLIARKPRIRCPCLQPMMKKTVYQRRLIADQPQACGLEGECTIGGASKPPPTPSQCRTPRIMSYITEHYIISNVSSQEVGTRAQSRWPHQVHRTAQASTCVLTHWAEQARQLVQHLPASRCPTALHCCAVTALRAEAGARFLPKLGHTCIVLC